MNEKEVFMELGKTLADIRNSLQACVESIDGFLNYLGKPSEASRENIYDKLAWENREGRKGPFQMVSAKAPGDEDLFRHLVNILKQNKRRYSEKGWVHFYWLGSDDNAVFRREKEKAKT